MPEVQYALGKLCDRRVGPVQVGLLNGKLVVIVFTASSFRLPCRSTKKRLPVIGLASENKIVTILAVRIIQRVFKPRMLGRDVVKHHINDHPNITPMGFGD
ncbi:hypothetical protein D3C80_1217540 [compost metagenome]